MKRTIIFIFLLLGINVLYGTTYDVDIRLSIDTTDVIIQMELPAKVKSTPREALRPDFPKELDEIYSAWGGVDWDANSKNCIVTVRVKKEYEKDFRDVMSALGIKEYKGEKSGKYKKASEIKASIELFTRHPELFPTPIYAPTPKPVKTVNP